MPINNKTGQWEEPALNTSWLPQASNPWNSWDNDPYNPNNTSWGASGAGAANQFQFDTTPPPPPLPPPSADNGFGGLAGLAGNIQANPGQYFNQSAGSQNPPPPATSTPPPGSKPPAPDPRSFFRTDVAPGWNPTQYANQAGQQNVQSLLNLNPNQFSLTATGGPFGVPQQSVFNYGGENHNTGLFQNLVNQYGFEQAKKMLDAEAAYAKANGGGNWSLTNDGSLVGYEGYRPSNLAAQSNPALLTPTQSSYNANNYTSPQTFQQAMQQAGQNSASSLGNTSGSGGTGSAGNNGAANQQQNSQYNQFMQMLMMIMMMGGLGGQQRQTPTQVNRNPLYYSLFY